jgi:hypothetical protein
LLGNVTLHDFEVGAHDVHPTVNDPRTGSGRVSAMSAIMPIEKNAFHAGPVFNRSNDGLETRTRSFNRPLWAEHRTR